MNNLFTIGFTQKTAENFFELLKQNNIETIIDIRLNNTSQLSGFAKYPDIKYFLNQIVSINYIHDKNLSPEERTLKRYKKHDINWGQYVNEFSNTMQSRKIDGYIYNKYKSFDNICLLCSEPTAERCHRSLVSNIFKNQFKTLNIINL